MQLVCQIFGELACVFLGFIFLKISDLSVKKLEKLNIFLFFFIFGINLYFCIIELEFSNTIPLLTNHMKNYFCKQHLSTSALADMEILNRKALSAALRSCFNDSRNANLLLLPTTEQTPTRPY